METCWDRTVPSSDWTSSKSNSEMRYCTMLKPAAQLIISLVVRHTLGVVLSCGSCPSENGRLSCLYSSINRLSCSNCTIIKLLCLTVLSQNIRNLVLVAIRITDEIKASLELKWRVRLFSVLPLPSALGYTNAESKVPSWRELKAPKKSLFNSSSV